MQEVFEKIKERLEDEHERCINRYGIVGGNLPASEVKRCIGIINQVAEEYKNDFCEWFKYDYRTIAPKNHDVENPYWRIPEDMGKLMFCPYCGKKIKVVER